MASLFNAHELLTNVRTSENGSDWYFAIFAVMVASVIAFTILLLHTPRGERSLHYLSVGAVIVASMAYLSMASKDSTLLHDFSHYSTNYGRQVFIARYIDWFVTTPLLLVDLMVLAGSTWSTIFWTVVVDELMICAGLYGAISEFYTYYFFGFGCLCYVYIVYTLIWKARQSARALGSDVHRLYVGVAIYTAALWTLYPIVWSLSEAGDVTSTESEAAFYGVLDLLAKPVCALWILVGKSSITRARKEAVRQQVLLDEKTFVRPKEAFVDQDAAAFVRQLRS